MESKEMNNGTEKLPEGWKLYGKYSIKHADGTPVKGKSYFVLRLDSDDPGERARVSAAMSAYLGEDAKRMFGVMDRCHDFLSMLCRDGKCDDNCSACLGASDLADDVWELMNPWAKYKA